MRDGRSITLVNLRRRLYVVSLREMPLSPAVQRFCRSSSTGEQPRKRARSSPRALPTVAQRKAP